jgi:hypothetical protein
MKRQRIRTALVMIVLSVTFACTLMAPGVDPADTGATVDSMVQSTVVSMQATLQGDHAATQAALRATEQDLRTQAIPVFQTPTAPATPEPKLPGVDDLTGTEAPTLAGAITGNLSYPSEFIPALTVVAFNLENGQWFYVQTEVNQATYVLDDLPVGTYHVVAYPQPSAGIPDDVAAGYTEMVPCGLATNCTDHTLIPVQVKAGETITGIDPGDWYAGPGAFPAYPEVR